MKRRKLLTSEVAGFEGFCAPTWINTNEVDRRAFGSYTGFFKLVKVFFGIRFKVGKEFHGYVTPDGKVRTTEGIF